MVRKPASELTANETSLLVIAARLMSATKRVEDTPTTSEELKYMDARIDEEIVAIQKIFDTFKSGSKMPRVHPIIQAVGAEWKTASDAKRRFNWTVLTTSYITQLCETVRKEHPEWHASLSSLTLDSYLDGLHPTRLWWLEGHPAAQKTSDGMICHQIHQLQWSFQALLLPILLHHPAHSHNTRGKGKRAVNAQVADLPSAPSKPPYALRGTKRRADPDNPEGESDSTTPQKSDLPRVEVAQASPPRPTQRQRTEASATIAYEQDRCGPCALANEVECRAQSNSRSFSCVRCASKHKVCDNPAPSWSIPLRRAMESRSSGAGSPAMWEARLDARLDAQEQRMEAMDAVNRDNNEKLARILLLNNQGVDVLSIPGVGATPYNRRSASPMTSTSSVGAQMSGLGISDARSTSSFSSMPSDRRRQPSGGSVASGGRGGSVGRAASVGRLTPSGVSGRSSSAGAVA
ncbi:hypothetical protein EDB92DRAFT_1949633 [Lactarius akahatsu]|uniref:Uncharacterized protein n=1 Tax=Lactarius akahatsu TaxID=416441 RepID=A0AAD4LBS7_9AGAM|nr:hypothetical protein EDB92DRAFT_1949633 [Lactarius akahatsu]